jgi:hypothetical protein
MHAPKPAARRRPSSSSGALPPPSQRADRSSRWRGPRRPQPPLPTLASAASPDPPERASNTQPLDPAGAPPDPEPEVAAATRRPWQECAGFAAGAAGSVPGGPPADRSTDHRRATPARSQGSHQPATAPSVGSAAGTGGSAARVAGTAPGGPPAGWSTRRRRVNASPPWPRLRDTGGRASEGRGGGGTRRSAAAGDLGGGDLEVVGVGGEKEGREEKKGG